MPTLFNLRSGLVTELKEYLHEQYRDAAALAAYFPAHLREASAHDTTGFDGVRQKVHVRTSQRERGIEPVGVMPVYDPIGSRPERRHLDYFGHEENTERELVAWDESAGDKYRRAIVLGDPGYGKTWLLRYEQRRLARNALRDLHDQRKPLEEVVVPIWIRLPELAAVDQPVEECLITKAMTGQSRRSSGFGRFIRSLLRTNRCVVLLDAWDEVPREEWRKANCPRTALGRRLASFARQYSKPRILITSRIVEFAGSPIPSSGQPNPDGTIDKVEDLELMAFDPEQVEAVINVWFTQHPGKQSRILELLKINEQVRGLARIPLMLTLMCRAWQEDRESSLTGNKCELFEKCLLGLLGQWAQEDGQVDRPQPNFVRLSALLALLQTAAFNLTQEGHQQFDVSVLMETMEELLSALQEAHPLNGEGVENLIVQLRSMGVFSTSIVRSDASLIFLHRIFQEYLAARHLVERIKPSGSTQRGAYLYTSLRTEAFPGKLVEKAREDAKRWWEVVLLAGTELKRRSEARVWELVGALCPRELGFGGGNAGMAGVEDADLKLAWLGGQVLLETGVASAGGLSTEQRTIRERVQKSLGWLLNEGRLTVRERAQAGVVLGRLGDLRPGVGLYGEGSPSQGLPQFDWVMIKAGVFPMGGREGWRAGEQHNCGELKRHFMMSRYPVTGAQYAAFVKAGGYEEGGRRWWTEAGWAWRIKRGITGPEVYRREVFQTGNHPQVGISWFEAVAFCNWATEVLRESGLLGGSKRIALASEAEWERVAGGLRGGVVAWGSDETAMGERCNCDESQIGATCAVGMFPSGVSEDGLRDLTGNVWEWTRSEFRDYPYRAGDGRELSDGGNRRVVRGGSWDYIDRDYLRVTIRDDNDPDFRISSIGFRCVMMDGTSR